MACPPNGRVYLGQKSVRRRLPRRGAIIFITILASVSAPFLVRTLVKARGRRTRTSNHKTTEPARLSDRASVRAEGRGDPRISLGDGHDLLTAFAGPAELRGALEQNEAQPLTLASADFDEDGVPDLVSGYEYNGQGIVTVLRGNVDSIYPNAPEATQRRNNGTFTDAPFLSPARVFAAPVGADFLGAGDFDGDSHWDVVVGSRSANSLYLLSGDGRGTLALTNQIKLPGKISALITGEINRADGLVDIVVGVTLTNRARVMVFEGPQGAFRATPETFDIPSEVHSLALGNADEYPAFDLAIASDNGVTFIPGRDRMLSQDQTVQKQVRPAAIIRRTFDEPVAAVSFGDFLSAGSSQVAALTKSGRLNFVWADQTGLQSVPARQPGFAMKSESNPSLIRARLTGGAGDVMVVSDSNFDHLSVLGREPGDAGGLSLSDQRVSELALLNPVDGTPRAVLPMRLDPDALEDLVILRSGRASPVLIKSGAEDVSVHESWLSGASLQEPGSGVWANFRATGGSGLPTSNGLIAFASYRDDAQGNKSEIYSMNPDGSNQTRLTFNVSGGVDPLVPVWSPDGTKILFSAFQNSYDVYVMNANGSGLTNLTNTPSIDEFSPAWSGDGSKIAYIRGGNIWVMNANGSQQTQLVSGGSPSWSPDGTKIVFLRTIIDFSRDIFVMNANGTGITNITNNPGSYDSPHWSPDGTKIVFANSSIFVMNGDGSGKTVITSRGSSPAWSPDGSKIVFSRSQSSNQDIYVMDANGSNVFRLTTAAGTDSFPSWQPSSIPGPTPTPTPIPTPTPSPSPGNSPPNDLFANAQVIAGLSDGLQATNVGATKEAGEPNHAGNPGGCSVWYRWQVPAAGDASLFIFGGPLLAVYTGTAVNALTPVPSGPFVDRLTFQAVAGQVYYIAADSPPAGAGSFFFFWELDTHESDAAIFSKSDDVLIPDSSSPPGKATTYPSTINVSGMGTSVTRITVQLTGLRLDSPNDVDILLVGPEGQSATIMSDVGGDQVLNSTTITLDDFAAHSLPADSPISSGTFKPTNNGSSDSFPAPAPAPSGSSALSVFNGTNPNGTWSLYVVDDNGNGKSNRISEGWKLSIGTGPTTTAPLVVTNTNDSGPGSLRQAIIKSNVNPGTDSIVFSIDSGPKTIASSGLPLITESATIDATTQPGFTGTPIITVSSSDPSTFNLTGGSILVRGFILNGLSIEGPDGNNIVEGNYVFGSGIDIDGSPQNIIGGTTAGARNVISTDSASIQFASEVTIGFSSGSVGNQIRGNFIGTNISGTAPPANGEADTYGIQLFSGTNTVIGGTTAGARNIINNGGISSIFILGSNATEPQGGALIQGNYIGVDVTGSQALSNKGGGGVWISGQSQPGSPVVAGNLIGGTVTAARNIISGHTEFASTSAVGIAGNFNTQNLIQGNFIGTDATGHTAIANSDGVQLVPQQPGSVIGGSVASAGNLISGNLHNGISLGRFESNDSVLIGGTGATIQNNFIGTDVNGTACIGNSNDGIYVEVTTVIHTIKDNLIACNGHDGISIPNVSANPGTVGTPAFQINIDSNLVYGNTLMGIDLGVAGITPNDPLDVDAGANLLQNFPVLTSVAGNAPEGFAAPGTNKPETGGTGAPVTVNGTLNSKPNTTFTVHWYFSADAQCVTNQQATKPLVTGKVPGVATNGNGDAQFSFPLDLPPGINTGIVNCTATDPQGNTSEFSACLPVASSAPSPTPTPVVQFSASAYSVGEGSGTVTVTVTRTGSTAATSAVDYKTTDTDTFSVNCAAKQGSAFGRCDFAMAVGTLNFAAGEASRSFTVPLIDDSFAEGNETFSVVLSNPTGAGLGSPATAAVTINDNETTDQPNPIMLTNDYGISFLVRQNYLDFLGREPEPTEPWSSLLRNCSDQFNTDPANPASVCDRLTVSGSFFGSPEFKTKGVYVIDFYRVAFDRLPSYIEFSQDLASITGTNATEAFAKRAAYADRFVQRGEFAVINNKTNTDYVNALMNGTQSQAYNLTSIRAPNPASPDDTAESNKVTLTRTGLINSLNGGTLTRAQVLRAVVQSEEISVQLEAVNAFVASQYYGYLRRTPDPNGFNNWVNHLKNHPDDFRTMINGFENSTEYRLRFGS